jgi:hypothetical protein
MHAVLFNRHLDDLTLAFVQGLTFTNWLRRKNAYYFADCVQKKLI